MTNLSEKWHFYKCLIWQSFPFRMEIELYSLEEKSVEIIFKKLLQQQYTFSFTVGESKNSLVM